MQKGVFRKGFVLGIIALFVGTSIPVLNRLKIINNYLWRDLYA